MASEFETQAFGYDFDSHSLDDLEESFIRRHNLYMDASRNPNKHATKKEQFVFTCEQFFVWTKVDACKNKPLYQIASALDLKRFNKPELRQIATLEGVPYQLCLFRQALVARLARDLGFPITAPISIPAEIRSMHMKGPVPEHEAQASVTNTEPESQIHNIKIENDTEDVVMLDCSPILALPPCDTSIQCSSTQGQVTTRPLTSVESPAYEAFRERLKACATAGDVKALLDESVHPVADRGHDLRILNMLKERLRETWIFRPWVMVEPFMEIMRRFMQMLAQRYHDDCKSLEDEYRLIWDQAYGFCSKNYSGDIVIKPEVESP